MNIGRCAAPARRGASEIFPSGQALQLTANLKLLKYFRKIYAG